MPDPGTSYKQSATDPQSLDERLDYIIERILPNNRQIVGLLFFGNIISLCLRGAVYTEGQHSFNLWIGCYTVCHCLYHRYHPRKSSTPSETAEAPPPKDTSAIPTRLSVETMHSSDSPTR
jgi:hypothetical protein